MQPRQTDRPHAEADGIRVAMYCREIAERAAIFYRLNYPLERAIARLQANADWDFEIGSPRPAALDASAVARIARETYARRPAR